jgi:plastocyanin
MNMRAFVMAGAVVALGVGIWGCGGNGYGSANSVAPTAPAATSQPNGSGAVTINVVGINGALSFSPNPASLPAGQMVVWHNVDGITHHVVFDDGSVDTGNLDPGASSQPQAIGTAGGGYHCSIHPVMVGSVNQDTAPPPVCQRGYCN